MKKLIKRCEALARKGTGTGTCERPVDQYGLCDRPGDHIADLPDALGGVTENELRDLETGLQGWLEEGSR